MEDNDKKQPAGPDESKPLSMAPDDFETQPQLTPVIEQLRKSRAVEPGPDLTLRVMADIAETQSEMADAASAARQMKARATSLMRYLTEAPSVSDIALCFLLAGFFYFLLGVIFFLGLQTLQPLQVTAGWLRLQPQVAMLTAGMLGTIGLLLLFDGGIAMHLAQVGTLLFIVFSVFNGTWISLEPAAAFAPIGLICFTAAPVLLGLFLAASLQRYRRRVPAG
jgi:hypothetical protein